MNVIFTLSLILSSFQGLATGGPASHLLEEDESLIVNALLDLPNSLRAKIVEFTGKTSGWVRVGPEDISENWLERLVEAGIVNVGKYVYGGDFG